MATRKSSLRFGGEDIPVLYDSNSDDATTYALRVSSVASNQSTLTTALQGDLRTTGLYSADHTLGTANTVTSFTIPAGSRGFKIVNPSADLRVMANANPPASNTATSGTAVTISSDFGAYNLVKAGTTEVRIFEPGAIPTTVRVNSATANATFSMVVF